MEGVREWDEVGWVCEVWGEPRSGEVWRSRGGDGRGGRAGACLGGVACGRGGSAGAWCQLGGGEPSAGRTCGWEWDGRRSDILARAVERCVMGSGRRRAASL